MNLSDNFEHAKAKEEYYRDKLLFWKQKRQELEQLIPVNDVFQEFINELFCPKIDKKQ